MERSSTDVSGVPGWCVGWVSVQVTVDVPPVVAMAVGPDVVDDAMAEGEARPQQAQQN